MSGAPAPAPPRAENGILYVGPEPDEQLERVRARWRSARGEVLGEGLLRIDLSSSPRGSCPGYNDVELLAELSRRGPGVAFGFFCDGVGRAEGVRVFEAGRRIDARHVEWDRPPVPDPIAWPIASLALSLGLSVERLTRVERPPRPALPVAVEALLAGARPEDDALRRRALDLLGSLDLPEASAALARALESDDWIDRYHAARAYARRRRGQGSDGLPRLEEIGADPDESVREALLEGIQELIPEVDFQDTALQEQIDRAVSHGLEDEDEDVRAAAARARALREELLG